MASDKSVVPATQNNCHDCGNVILRAQLRKFDMYGRSYHQGCSFLVGPPKAKVKSALPSPCELCGEPMPAGEEMFKFHGYSGDCPKPPKPDAKLASVQAFEKWWPSHSYHTFRLTKDDALKVWIASRENL